MPHTERFTIADLDAMPDDGFRRELLDGVLLVNPLAASRHQLVAMRLYSRLAVYLQTHATGVALAPGRVQRADDTALEPDILVLPGPEAVAVRDWADQPTPLLVVEIVSPSSRSFDHVLKRDAYMRLGVPEYWIVDPRDHCVVVVTQAAAEQRVIGTLEWRPSNTHEPFLLEVSALFADL